MKNKMLIIDDSEDICFSVSEFFKFKDWDVDSAYDVEEGLNNLHKKKYDIILVDYNMPNINGALGVKLIRQIELSTPIIALTVEGKEEIANKFFEAGVNDFAMKPIKMLDLFFRVNVHLKKEDDQKVKKEACDKLDHPKGIDDYTFDIIKDILKKDLSYLNVDDIIERTGVASKTVNRYLNYMLDINLVRLNIIYGKVGRPKKGYMWID